MIGSSVTWLRATVIGTSISLLVSLVVITPGSAAVKAGGECKKVGLKTQFKGNSFICIQSGNKKIWKVAKKEKPVALPTVLPTSTLKPTPTPTPTPSQSLTPKQTPTPTPSPTFPREPKNFSDISDYDQVTYWAWRKSSDKIKSSESIVKEVEVLIGPKSGILNKNPLEATQIKIGRAHV